jgi:tubulysin polyketide synthase-like protein
MNPAASLLQELASLDIVLQPEGSDLKYDAPKGRLTPDLFDRIRRHKPALIELLRVREPIWVASDRSDVQPRAERVCHVCGGAHFWRHAQYGHWLCSRCHPPSCPDVVGDQVGQEPPAAQTGAWGPGLEPLVNWFLKTGQHRIPNEPFRLTPWIEVTQPDRFREAILFDISRGPDGPRNRFGALEEDLRRIHAQFFHHEKGTPK